MSVKGKLLIIGGAEEKGDDILPSPHHRHAERFEVLKEMLKNCKNKTIEIITTGTRFHEETKQAYQAAFSRIGYHSLGFMAIKSRPEAHAKHYLDRVKKAGAIFFSGGDQFRLSTILGGTKLIDVLQQRYREDTNFLIAGTSAGAMAMSSIMITGGGKHEALFNDDLGIAAGLGFIRQCIVDTHFIKRGRFGRLAHAVILNPGQLGIGLGEDTALIISNAYNAECRGSGTVVIIDGKSIGQTNVRDVPEHKPLYVENLRVHLLVRGCRFSIKTRKLKKPLQLNGD